MNVAHNGQAANILNADSFYYIDVTAGANYTVSVTDKSVPVALAVTNKSSFGTPYLYISDDYTDTDEETTQSPSGSRLYILVESSGSDGAYYTVTVTLAAPDAPSGVTASTGNAKATISWPSVAGASSYNIYWSTTSGSGMSGTQITGVTSPRDVNGLTNGTPHYFVVTAVNSSGESVISNEVSGTPEDPVASFPATYNFDDGTLQGWTATGTWGLTTSTYNSANYCITDSPAGSFAVNTSYTITSPTFDLTGISNPTLTFWFRNIFENSGSTSGLDWYQDNGYVEISTNGGATWTTYDNSFRSTKPWQQHTIPLSSYKSNNVKIRLGLYSNGSIVSDGWYIDDIVIQ